MGDQQALPAGALPPESVVLRGGPMAGKDGANTMSLNAVSEFLDSGRWALSVFSGTDLLDSPTNT
jgi:hypothetical protein